MGRYSANNQHLEKSSNSTSLNINNETITDDLTISNHFNNFFTSVAKNLVNKIYKTPKFFHSYLKNSDKNFFITHNKAIDIEGILSMLKTNRTAGPGSVATRIITDFKKCLSKSISYLINSTFSLEKL